jgi:VanZ family protein
MLYWLPVLVYLTVIFSLSAQPNLRPPLQFQNSDKLCHLLEYAGLGLLLGRALRAGLDARPALLAAAGSLLLASLVAACDEVFQRSVPGRQASVFDWAADTLGAAIATGIIVWVSRERRRVPR